MSQTDIYRKQQLGGSVEKGNRTALIVVDFAPHSEESFRDRYQHRYLGFDEDSVIRWCRRAGLEGSVAHRLARDDVDALTTLIWYMTKPTDWSAQ